MLQITPASTNPALTYDAFSNGWNNVFRVCGRDDAQGLVVYAEVPLDHPIPRALYAPVARLLRWAHGGD